MAGVKGRSGRKSTSDAQKRQRVIDLAWDTMFEALSDKTLCLSVRAELAKSIVVKNIPQEVESKAEVTVTVVEKNVEERLGCLHSLN